MRSHLPMRMWVGPLAITLLVLQIHVSLPPTQSDFDLAIHVSIRHCLPWATGSLPGRGFMRGLAVPVRARGMLAYPKEGDEHPMVTSGVQVMEYWLWHLVWGCSLCFVTHSGFSTLFLLWMQYFWLGNIFHRLT